MNNKGFAITGIIYATFVLFLVILLSILGNLRFRNKVLEKTIASYDDTYVGNGEESKFDLTKTTAEFTGIYEYGYSDIGTNFNSNIGYCYMYMYKGSSFPTNNNGITFTTSECNTVKNNGTSSFSLTGVYYKIGE